MYKLFEKFTNANMAGLEAFKTVVNTSLDSAGQLAALNLRTAQAVFERGAGNLNTLLAVRNVEGLKALRQPMAMAAVEQSIAYSRQAYEICSESSSAMVQAVEGQSGLASRSLLTALDKGRKAVSPAFSPAMATAKALMSMAKQGYGQLGQIAGTGTAVAVPDAASPVPASVKLIEKTA